MSNKLSDERELRTKLKALVLRCVGNGDHNVRLNDDDLDLIIPIIRQHKTVRARKVERHDDE